MKFPPEIAVTAGLLALHTAVITLPQRPLEFATSNIITNCIRITDLRAATRPSHILAGSSMTGRLNAEAAATAAGETVINLGLDGCGPAEALDFLMEAQAPLRTVFLELNAAGSVAPQNTRAVLEATSGPVERLRRAIPFLRHQERPIDLIYSRLHHRAEPAGTAAAPPLQLPEPSTAAATAGIPQDPIAAIMLEKIRAIQARGCRIILVMLPDQGSDRPREYAIARQLSAAAGLPFLDLKPALDQKLAYTDSVHLAADSGTRLAAALGAWLKANPAP